MLQVLALGYFKKKFEVGCDAFVVDIGTILTQEGYPIAYCIKKNPEIRKKWWTYEFEVFSVIQALNYWNTYLIHWECILNTYHHALNFSMTSHKENKMQNCWQTPFNKYNFLTSINM